MSIINRLKSLFGDNDKEEKDISNDVSNTSDDVQVTSSQNLNDPIVSGTKKTVSIDVSVTKSPEEKGVNLTFKKDIEPLDEEITEDSSQEIVEEVEVAEKRLSRTDVFYNMARPAKFSIDLGKSYPGYTFNEHWNGWECPYFTKEVAEEICKDFSFTYTFSS